MYVNGYFDHRQKSAEESMVESQNGPLKTDEKPHLRRPGTPFSTF